MSLLLGGSLCTSASLSGQARKTPDGPSADPRPPVTLHVSVTDGSGAFVANIPQAAFKVTEDGVEQSVKDFRMQESGVSMGIIIDRSASMRERMTGVGSLTTLLDGSRPQDELFIIDFDDDPYLDQSFTSDQQKLTTALGRTNFRGGSAMRNAIGGALDYIRTSAKKDTRVLVVLTDGDDNASGGTTLEQLLRKVRDSGVAIYAIGLLNEGDAIEARRAKRALDSLTEISGGLSFYPKDAVELSRAVQVIAEVHTQYLLSYVSTNSALDGSFRKTDVSVKWRSAAHDTLEIWLLRKSRIIRPHSAVVHLYLS